MELDVSDGYREIKLKELRIW